MTRYDSYKDSGVKWIGEIPIDWRISRVKKYFNERNEKVSDIDFKPLSVTKKGIVPQLENVSKSDNHNDRKKVCINDFVINSRSDRKGSSGMSNFEGSVSLINIVLEPKNIIPKFSEYIFKSKNFIEEFFRNGKGIHWDLWSTRFSELQNIKIPIPSINQQQQIIEFLDTKTELIDSLIEKTERKIELLKEKRTSLINETVTKGLNPNVEMKDSGVEWIGKIPSHWVRTNVRMLIGKGFLEVQDGNHGEIHPKSEDYIDDGIPFVMSNNLRDGIVDYESCKKLDKDLTDKLRIGFSKNGDVLLTHKGTIGRVSIVSEMDYPYIMLTPQVTYYRCLDNSISNRHLYYQFQSDFFQKEIDLLSSDGSTRKFIGIVDQRNLPLLIIPVIEQQQIVDYLDEQTEIIDKTISNEEKRIELLKEYRQSLISEVVTGKRKVTN